MTITAVADMVVTMARVVIEVGAMATTTTRRPNFRQENFKNIVYL